MDTKLLLSAQPPQRGSFVLFCFVLIFLVAECPEAKRVNKMGRDSLGKFSWEKVLIVRGGDFVVASKERLGHPYPWPLRDPVQLVSESDRPQKW